MLRTSAACSSAALALLLAPTTATASAHQLHGGVGLGVEWSDGARGGLGGLVIVHGAYDLSDSFRLYANLQYGLSAADMANTPRHEGTVSAGVVYVIDVLSIVPWIGLGFEGSVVSTPAWTGVVPLGEVRGGLDYLPARTWGFTLQVSYGIAVVNRSDVADVVNVFLGVRFTTDL